MQRGRTARRAGVEYAGAGAEAEDTGAGAVVSGSQIMQHAGRTRQACVGPGRAYLRTRRESQYVGGPCSKEQRAPGWWIPIASDGRAHKRSVRARSTIVSQSRERAQAGVGA